MTARATEEAGAIEKTGAAGTTGASGTGTAAEIVKTLATRPAAVEVHDVHKWYGSQRVLEGVALAVRPGEVAVVLGPSGSGKSTPCV